MGTGDLPEGTLEELTRMIRRGCGPGGWLTPHRDRRKAMSWSRRRGWRVCCRWFGHQDTWPWRSCSIRNASNGGEGPQSLYPTASCKRWVSIA